MEKGHARVLAVESSCDETAIAIVEDGRRVLANAIASQVDTHTLYGGVVPEIASRMHVEALDPLMDMALEEAGLTIDDIDAVAVTCGPGLVGALLTGVSWAKGLACARKLPLIGVNHIEGHVSANYVANPELEPPFLCLVASGGHSHIMFVEKYGQYRLLGQTTDDAAGEAFDKVARVLNIPYPGGPLMDKLARTGNQHAYPFPKVATKGKYDFSFSGLKTYAVNRVHNLSQQGLEVNQVDFAASYSRAAVDMLVDKTMLAAQDTGAKRLAAAGGVASNSMLREELALRAQKMGIELFLPPPKLCTDNAVMIASAAFYRLMAGETASMDLNALPSLAMFK